MNSKIFCKEATKYNLVIDSNDLRTSSLGGLKLTRAGLVSVDDDDFPLVREMFEKEEPIDLELLHLEFQDYSQESGFYIAQYKRLLDRSATISFRRLDTGKVLPFQLKFGLDGSISGSGSSSVGQDFNDLAFGGYTNWCGRWRGRRRRWRVCTGEDCGSGHGLCFQYRFPSP